MKKTILVTSILFFSFNKNDIVRINTEQMVKKYKLKKDTIVSVIDHKKDKKNESLILIKVIDRPHKNFQTWINEKHLSPVVFEQKKENQTQIIRKILHTRGLSSDAFDETKINSPIKEVNESVFHTTLCGGRDAGYDLCLSRESNLVESIRITNFGGNNIVKKNEYYINRSFEFSFEDQARSDMRLLVVDSPDDKTSHTTYSVMVFLPRLNLPAVRSENENLIVTLNNNEEVTFNGKTHEIISGVLKEGAMEQNEVGKAIAPALTYVGKGVMIKADKTGDLPFGDTEDSKGNALPSTSTATVYKVGSTPCKIPAKDIWYTDYNKSSNIFIKKELASDEGMNNFLKTRCGFTIN